MWPLRKIDYGRPDAWLEKEGIISILLKDRSTGKNIRWCTDTYADMGMGYQPEDEITLKTFTAIRPRAERGEKTQKDRTKKKAEVYTPLRVAKEMNNMLIEHAWRREDFGDTTWESVLEAKVLEIACGEAPFLTHIHDSETGEYVRWEERHGLLDLKFEAAWWVAERSGFQSRLGASFAALKTAYGYEWSGDNLFLARFNVLGAWYEFVKRSGAYGCFSIRPREAAEIISWNLWQMDGLTGTVPMLDDEAYIMDWEKGTPVTYNSLLPEEQDGPYRNASKQAKNKEFRRAQ